MVLFLIPLFFNFAISQIPVVLWHGMGDSSRGPFTMDPLIKLIEHEVPGIYVKSIKIGNTDIDDVINSFFKDINSQIETVCHELGKDTKLENGFNAVGFSQGGQFLRGLVQRCSSLKVLNLISIAGQHQGVFGFPKCTPEFSHICEYLRALISKGAYDSYIQKYVVQAQYWHDPHQEDVYIKKSKFIAEVNQEQSFNSTYRENMIRLKNFVLAKSNNDTVVIPKDTEWFGYYVPGQDKEIYNLEESELYKKDLLGLKTLKEDGRLHLISFDGDHLKFKKEWFINEIIRMYLR